MAKIRNYIQARNLFEEAKVKIKDFDAIMGQVKKEYDLFRGMGITCDAFKENNSKPIVIQVTKQCWNHVFKHPVKRQTRMEKLERALCFDLAIKLLKKTTTYQEVSRETDKGGNEHLFFGIVGYVRGNRIKVIIRKQLKCTDPSYILFSFFQM
jgi:hypothetical protein